MSVLEKVRKCDHRRERYFLGLAMAWTIIVAGSLLLNIRQVRRNTEEAARIQARVAHEKDVLYRRWNAGHGGVYVPVTEETQPNPYLSDILERDITISNGQQLTLMNPAYMTRQVHELQQEEYGVRGHITSLKPIRLENIADEWETEALLAFENGVTEVSSIELLEGQEYMRLMRPLVTEDACLKCHATQGYQVGDIRGGISVSVPMATLEEIERDQVLVLWVGHISLWLLGLGGIYWVRGRLGRGEQARLRAEQILMESEARFRAIFEQASVGVALIRFKTGEYIRVNQRFGDMLGYSIDELQSKTFMDVTHPDDLPTDEDNLGRFMRGETRGVSVTKRYLHKDGSIVWVNLNGSTLWGKGDEPDQNIAIIEDITERKQAEQLLRESEAKLKNIVEHSTNLFYSHDPNHALIYLSPQAKNILGYEPEEALVRWTELATEHPINQIGLEMTQRAIDTGQAQEPYELELQHKSGAHIWVEVREAPVVEDGRTVAIVGALTDITKRKFANEAMRRRAEEMAALHAATLEFTTPSDLDPILESIVARATELLGGSSGGLYLCDPEKREARCVVSYKTARDFTGTVLKYGEGAAGIVAETGKPLIIDDYRIWEGRADVYNKEESFQAILSVPVAWRKQVKGVLHVLRDIEDTKFGQVDLDLLMTLANHAAIAMENARLLQQIQRYADELEERVDERTKELRTMVNAMAGREVRMAELKEVIKKLRRQIETAGMTPIADDPLKEPLV